MKRRTSATSGNTTEFRFTWRRCIDSKTSEQRWYALGAARIEPEARAVLLVVHRI
jgi:hypothetical protein